VGSHATRYRVVTWFDRAAWDHSAAVGLSVEQCLDVDRGMVGARHRLRAPGRPRVWAGCRIRARHLGAQIPDKKRRFLFLRRNAAGRMRDATARKSQSSRVGIAELFEVGSRRTRSRPSSVSSRALRVGTHKFAETLLVHPAGGKFKDSLRRRFLARREAIAIEFEK
jgi:hypothetical protein